MGTRGSRSLACARVTPPGGADGLLPRSARRRAPRTLQKGGFQLTWWSPRSVTVHVMPDFGVSFGVALCEVAVVLIAVGANIQRYALSRISPARRWWSCVSVRTAVWLGGLSIYFFANVLYTIALVYAPASLCATLMATIVPINALSSRLILGEVLHLVDIQGGAAITAGISLAAYAAPYKSSRYDADTLASLILNPDSLLLLGSLATVIVVLGVLVLAHENGWCSCCCRNTSSQPSRTASVLTMAMPFCYPIVIGLLESFVQLAQKGGSSMLALTLGGQSQLGSPVFWQVICLWVGSSLLVVWWLRKGLRRVEASRLLPIEYGAFTSSSVLAGLVVYNEADDLTSDHLTLMGCGVVLVIAGCAFVGSRRAVRCEMRWTSDEAEEEDRRQREASLRESLLVSTLAAPSGQLELRLLKPTDTRSDSDQRESSSSANGGGARLSNGHKHTTDPAAGVSASAGLQRVLQC